MFGCMCLYAETFILSKTIVTHPMYKKTSCFTPSIINALLLTAATLPVAPVGAQQDAKAGSISAHSGGLHGYIGCNAVRPPSPAEYGAGISFYTAVWPLIDEPIANFQIGLAGTWIMPDNSDNKDTPLAPPGTYARRWAERGPTWAEVFQTIEGSPGYWAGNRFRYGSPKFSMNATPQCYDYEVGSPGWGFFRDDKPLPDNQLGIAQLSNRLLIPPDGLTFRGSPNGQFLGYAWMALPFTDPVEGAPPTGDQSWTCFLSTSNFKGPIAYYIPETWSKLAKIFDYPYIYGRGLDSRTGNISGGLAIEINTVPRFDAADAKGVVYTKIPKLQFPVDEKGQTILAQDVTYYPKSALYDSIKAWRKNGTACTGEFGLKNAWKSKLRTNHPGFDQEGKKISGVKELFTTQVFAERSWGLQWTEKKSGPRGSFPQYFKQEGDTRVVVNPEDVPAETGLRELSFPHAKPGRPYTSPATGAWATPGPKSKIFTAQLLDGSVVSYRWYRFVDQPSFQQYQWSKEKKAALQALIEKIHASWPIDRNYMAPPGQGELVSLDPALIVSPPKGMEKGYVPIVVGQAAK